MKKPRTERWAKTFGWLIVCMTLGGTLLSVAKPPGPPAANAALVSRTPADVVGDLSAVEPHLWRNVVLHRTAETRARPNSLLGVAGTTVERGCHFLIRPDGTVITSPAWREQRSVGPDPFGLHIGIVSGPFKNAIPRLQWNALRELLAHLQQRFRLDPAQIMLGEKSDTDSWPTLPGGSTGSRAPLSGSWRSR